MKTFNDIRNGLGDTLSHLESELLYGILPLAGHPKFLVALRRTSAWLSRRAQQTESAQISLAHQCSLAHQTDIVRAQILLEELELIIRSSDVVSMSPTLTNDTLTNDTLANDTLADK